MIILISVIISDIKIVSTKDFVNKLFKIFTDGQNTEYNSNSPEYHKGVYDTVQFYKQKYPDWSEEHIIKMLDDGILSTDI